MDSKLNPFFRLWPPEVPQANKKAFEKVEKDLSEIFSKSQMKNKRIESSFKHGAIRQLDLDKYIDYIQKEAPPEEALKLCKCLYKMNRIVKDQIGCLDSEQRGIFAALLKQVNLKQVSHEFPRESLLLAGLCTEKLFSEKKYDQQEIFELTNQLGAKERLEFYHRCANSGEATRKFLIIFLNRLPLDGFTRTALIELLASKFKSSKEVELLQRSVDLKKLTRERRFAIFKRICLNPVILLDSRCQIEKLPIQDFSSEEIAKLIKALVTGFHREISCSFQKNLKEKLTEFTKLLPAISQFPLHILSVEERIDLFNKIAIIEPKLKLEIIEKIFYFLTPSFFSFYKSDPLHLSSIPEEKLGEFVVELIKSDIRTLGFLLEKIDHPLIKKISKEQWLEILIPLSTEITLQKDMNRFLMIQKILSQLSLNQQAVVEIGVELFPIFISHPFFGLRMMKMLAKNDPEFIETFFTHKNLRKSDLSELADIFSKWELDRLFDPQLFNKFDEDFQKILARLLAVHGALSRYIDKFTLVKDDTWTEIAKMLLEKKLINYACIRKIENEKIRLNFCKRYLDLDFETTLRNLNHFEIKEEKNCVKLVKKCFLINSKETISQIQKFFPLKKEHLYELVDHFLSFFDVPPDVDLREESEKQKLKKILEEKKLVFELIKNFGMSEEELLKLFEYVWPSFRLPLFSLGWFDKFTEGATEEFQKFFNITNRKKVEEIIRNVDVTDPLDFQTYLHMAIYLKEPLHTVRFLIQKKCDPTIKDYRLQNVLHFAVEKKTDIQTIELLLNHPKMREHLNDKDMYGRTALDITLQNGFDAATELLQKIQKINALSKQKIHPTINQAKIINQLVAYLQLKKRTEEDFALSLPFEQQQKFIESLLSLTNPEDKSFKEKGVCNGLCFLASYYFSSGLKEEFYSILETISDWNATEEGLHKKIPKTWSGEYKDIDELFKHWINDIAWFQQDEEMTNKDVFISQKDRLFQFEMIKKREKAALHLQFSLRENPLTLLQIEEHFSVFSHFPGLNLDISAANHLVMAHVTNDKKFIFYDPNDDYKILEMGPVEISETIQKFSFSWQRRTSYSPLAFCLNGYQILPGKNSVEKPLQAPGKVPEELLKNYSVNGWTPLHFSVIFNDINIFEKELKNFINKKDAHGSSPLDLAIAWNREPLIKRLLEEKDIEIDDSIRISSIIRCLDTKNLSLLSFLEEKNFFKGNELKLLMSDKDNLIPVKNFLETELGKKQLHRKKDGGRYYLQRALKMKKLIILEWLIEAGAVLMTEKDSSFLEMVSKIEDRSFLLLFAEWLHKKNFVKAKKVLLDFAIKNHNEALEGILKLGL